MTEAERFHAWRSAHYPKASRVSTQLMYQAWCAAKAPTPAPKAAPKAAPKKSKKSVSIGSPGDE